MILPSDSKSKDLLDAANGETDVLAPSSSSSRFAPPNVPPPSYDFARPSTSITPSYYAPVSSTTQDVFSTPGGPPASFARVPPSHLTYPSFQSMFLVATGKTLDKGFPNASPPSNSNPHPFVTHDVKEGDWMSFLGEAQMAATLTDKQIMRSHLPIVSIIPIVNSLSSYGVKQYMKHRNASKVIDCIDKWNRHFFELRKLRIVLMKGQFKVSGQKEYQSNTSTSSTHKSGDLKHESPPPSSPGIGQGLVINDDVYRLFVVSLS